MALDYQSKSVRKRRNDDDQSIISAFGFVKHFMSFGTGPPTSYDSNECRAAIFLARREDSKGSFASR
jgi:hypothetical protein